MFCILACRSTSNLCQFPELCRTNFSARNNYTCSCPNTFMELGSDGLSCHDIDECAQYNSNSSACGQHQTCTNINVTGYTNVTRGYTCTCNDWFVQDPSVYTACFALNPCDYTCTAVGFQCTNYGNGNYLCACASGYSSANGTCVSIDYCAFAGICGQGNCTNVPGSYQCSCPAGYYYSNGSCLSLDYNISSSSTTRRPTTEAVLFTTRSTAARVTTAAAVNASESNSSGILSC